MKQDVYRQQRVDLKRLVLVLGKRMWLVLPGICLGALLGALVYRIVTGITNGYPEYRASADYYITFNFDEFQYGTDYYNAYTWDSILRDDPIVDYALTLLPEEVTKEMVKDAVTGEMLGDYRILTVHVTTTDRERTDQIAEAYTKAMTHFGEEIEMLSEIQLWSMEEATLLAKNTRTPNAAFLGGLLVGLGVLMGLLLYYCLEDGVYLAGDVEERYHLPLLGYRTKTEDSGEEAILQTNLQYLCGGEGEILWWDGEELPGPEEYEGLRQAKALVVTIPWGRPVGRKAGRCLYQLMLQGCRVKGCVLTGAENRFLKAYYGRGRGQQGDL